MLILSAFFLTIFIIWLIYWVIWGRFKEYTNDAYVGGNVVSVMPQISGTVVEINTDDTQLVTKGQVIVKLDTADTDIALQRAEANLAQTIRQVRQYFENVERAEANLILRGADFIKAKEDMHRRIGLVGERAISREEMQHYTTREQVAKASYDYALHSLRSALSLVENTHIYTHPLVERAKSVMRKAYLDTVRTTILAPATGYVAKRSVQVGQQVTPNTLLLAIIPLNEIWVDANYKESQLSNIRIDQPVTLYADTYGGKTFHGKVLGLTPVTGASLSLLPPQNATGNWIKIVQRLPVRIHLDINELKNTPLLIGLSMEVTVNTHKRDGNRLAKMSSAKPIYTTTIYNNQLAQVNLKINEILVNNAANLFMGTLSSNKDMT